MSPAHIDIGAATTKRARGYLRWYPSAWRERYGEEFVAHLEVELAERPVSFARTSDIVAHGLLARLTFQRGLRVALRTATAVALVTVATVGAIALTQYWKPVAFTSGYRGGQTGVGLFARPSQVADVSFNFATHARVAVRITSVTALPLRGFPVPQVVGVDFAAHASDLANLRGWPLRLPKSSRALEGNVPLVAAIGTTVTLAPTDALWLGLRAPALHHAYAVEGLQVTYERRGISHTMLISQGAAPDVVCASSAGSVQIPNWCLQEIHAANIIAMSSKDSPTSATWPTAQARMVSLVALNSVGSTGHGTPPLSEVRYWAARLFPANSAGAILSVTGVVNSGVPEWRFVIHEGTGTSGTVICTNRGAITEGGGVIGVGVESCPSKGRT